MRLYGSRLSLRSAGMTASLHIQRLGPRRLTRRIERDLLDPRFRCAQQLLAAPLQDLTALVDRDGFLKRNVAAFELLHDLLQLGERLLEGELCDVGIRGVGHASD